MLNVFLIGLLEDLLLEKPRDTIFVKDFFFGLILP